MLRYFILSILIFTSICYINPVQGDRDSPDPGAIFYNGSYYAVTTMGWDGHYFPIWKSQTATNFSQVGWAMPTPPAWTACCVYWAPQIHIINGRFVLYYTSQDKNHKLSIGSATSTNILGPYIDKGSPLYSTASSQGIIDPTILSFDSSHYLVYKANAQSSELWAVQLDPTGMATRGNPTSILKSTQPWQENDVEAPWFIKYGNYYYLFYSGSFFDRSAYAVGVARSVNPLGPYEKYVSNPILHTRNPITSKSWEGPGHCSVLHTPTNKYIMVYHAWPRGAIKTKRVLLMDQVKFVNQWPFISDHSPSQNQVPNP